MKQAAAHSVWCPWLLKAAVVGDVSAAELPVYTVVIIHNTENVLAKTNIAVRC